MRSFRLGWFIRLKIWGRMSKGEEKNDICEGVIVE